MQGWLGIELTARFGAALAAAFLLAAPMGHASAADLPSNAPVYNAPATIPPTWAGFYVGVNAGGVWSRTELDWDPNFGVGSDILKAGVAGTLKASGFTGGGQIGLNRQFDNLVFGIEADLQYTGLSGTRTGAVAFPATTDTFTQSMDSKWLGTLRGRLGVAFGSLLPYATGGLAAARVSYSDFVLVPFLPSSNTASLGETRVGWTLGGGAEWKFAPRWSIKAEYLYVDLGPTTYTSFNSVLGAGATVEHHHHLTENIARIGLNYSFWPAAN